MLLEKQRSAQGFPNYLAIHANQEDVRVCSMASLIQLYQLV